MDKESIIKYIKEKYTISELCGEKEYETKRDDFLKKYPFEKFQNLTLDEYTGCKALGDGEYFCNDLDKKYANLYTPISIYSSWFGIYKSNDGVYKTNKNEILNTKAMAEAYWNVLRNSSVQLIQLIIDGDLEGVKNFDLKDLSSMPQVLLKISMIYKPEHLLQIVKNDTIKEIYKDIFGNDNTNIYYKSMRLKMDFILKEFPNYDHVKISELMYVLYDNNEYNVKINYFAKKLEDLIEEDKDKKKVINLGIFGLMYAEEIQQFAIDAEKKLGSVCNDITNKANIGNFTGELYKYVNAMLHFENKNLEDSEKINTKLMKYQGKNTIFYGVPGCGKSRMLDKVVLEGVGAGFKKRVLFHPEYTYSDFVGQTMPVVRDGKITYEFVPGPFTEILKQAIKDKSLQENYYLIIEEINRGNAPAIFGDLFQLLDRKNGRSEYEITNKAIADWVYKDTENFGKDSVYIPSNLTLFATMNTCDQNVFTMDTAFKRRWKMVRVKNGFDDNECASFLNWKIDGLPFTWKEFATVVNDLILKCNDGVNAEDKQLGAYFVKEDEITDINAFAEKVLMYLWEDVVRYDKTQMFDSRFNTLDKVISGFCIGENVFVGDEMAKLYSRMSEEINADQA